MDVKKEVIFNFDACSNYSIGFWTSRIEQFQVNRIYRKLVCSQRVIQFRKTLKISERRDKTHSSTIFPKRNLPMLHQTAHLFEGKLWSNELFTSGLRFSVFYWIVRHVGYITNFLFERLVRRSTVSLYTACHPFTIYCQI